MFFGLEDIKAPFKFGTSYVSNSDEKNIFYGYVGKIKPKSFSPVMRGRWFWNIYKSSTYTTRYISTTDPNARCLVGIGFSTEYNNWDISRWTWRNQSQNGTFVEQDGCIMHTSKTSQPLIQSHL